MSNERLRRVIANAGMSLADVAGQVGADPKTVERWITQNRLPHPRLRTATAAALGVDEVYLWPESTESPQARSASGAELVRIYPNRGAVPAEYWYECIENATENIDLLAYSCTFLMDGHDNIGKLLTERAGQGVQIRILVGDPDSEAVFLRGDEEGIGDHMAARCSLSAGYLRDAYGVSGISIRKHGTTLYNSIYRFDNDIMVNTHAYGIQAGSNPVMHFRKVPGGQLFDHYVQSFDNVWAKSKAQRKPAERRRPGR